MNNKSTKYLFEEFCELEMGSDLYSKQIGGIPFWEYIRPTVFNKILQSKDLMGTIHDAPKKTKRKYLKNLYQMFKNIFTENPYFADECSFLFISNPRRMLLHDGNWWDIYTDPILEPFDDEQYTVLEPYSKYRNQSPLKNGVSYRLDLIQHSSSLYEKIWRQVGNPNLSIVDEINNMIEQYFGIKIDLKPLVKNVIINYKFKVPQYRKIFKKVDPDVLILTTGAYLKSEIQAAKDLSIPVVELQHGGGDKYHAGYEYPAGCNVSLFPDHIFVFGDYWKEQIRYPLPDSHVHAVGYPFHEMMRERYDQCGGNSVLFISQGPIGKQLSKMAVELSNYSLDEEIVYKLHPGEYDRWETEYPWLRNTNINVINSNEVPLYKLLGESKAVVGVYSTVMYESIDMFAETYLVDLPGVVRLEDLIRTGHAILVETVDELAEYIQNTPPRTRKEFFTSDSVPTIYKKLHQIASA